MVLLLRPHAVCGDIPFPTDGMRPCVVEQATFVVSLTATNGTLSWLLLLSRRTGTGQTGTGTVCLCQQPPGPAHLAFPFLPATFPSLPSWFSGLIQCALPFPSPTFSHPKLPLLHHPCFCLALFAFLLACCLPPPATPPRDRQTDRTYQWWWLVLFFWVEHSVGGEDRLAGRNKDRLCTLFLLCLSHFSDVLFETWGMGRQTMAGVASSFALTGHCNTSSSFSLFHQLAFLLSLSHLHGGGGQDKDRMGMHGMAILADMLRACLAFGPFPCSSTST